MKKPQGNVYRRRQVNAARIKGEQVLINALRPALAARFKAVSRDLRRSNLRKRLAKNGGLLHKDGDPTWNDWNRLFINTLYDALDDGLGYVFDAEQRYWLSHDFPIFPYNAPEVLTQYRSSARDKTRITNIAADMEAQVNEIVTEWFKTDAGLPKLIDLLEPLFGTRRAELIAITEMAYVASFVSKNMMQTYGITHWIWDAFDDAITCDLCLELMAQSKITPFSINDPMPPDPSHPRCRCGVYYVGVDV